MGDKGVGPLGLLRPWLSDAVLRGLAISIFKPNDTVALALIVLLRVIEIDCLSHL